MAEYKSLLSQNLWKYSELQAKSANKQLPDLVKHRIPQPCPGPGVFVLGLGSMATWYTFQQTSAMKVVHSYNKNKSGHRMDPCGTPQVTG